MSRKQNLMSKLITAVVLLGLVMGLSTAKLHAEGNPVVAFSNGVYTGRYVCSAATFVTGGSSGDLLTAVIKYNPNGGGAYSAGTLIAGANAGGLPPSGAFCQYNLDITASSYNIGTDGTGFESLSWVLPPPPFVEPSGCPTTGFIDQTSIVLRNNTDITGAVLRAETANANLLGQDEAGHGFCLK
jgi:hypothetical protein